MGLQEHEGEKEELAQEYLPQDVEEEKEGGEVETGLSAAPEKDTSGLEEEQKPTSVVATKVEESGGDVDKLKILATTYLPGTPEFDEMCQAVQATYGNDVLAAILKEDEEGGEGEVDEQKLDEATEEQSENDSEKAVMQTIAREPEPDPLTLAMVGSAVEAEKQAEFVTAVEEHTTEEAAAVVEQAVETGAAAEQDWQQEQAEGSQQAQASEAQAAVEDAGQQQTDADAGAMMAPEEAPVEAEEAQQAEAQEVAVDETQAEESAEVAAEVLESVPEVAPQQEEVQQEEPAEEAQAEQETEQKAEVVAEAAEEVKEESQEVAVEEPAQTTPEAVVEEEEAKKAEAAEDSQPELEQQQEEVVATVAQEVEAEPSVAETPDVLKELLAEAEELMAQQVVFMEAPVLETTPMSVLADAQAMMDQWCARVDGYGQQLTALAEKLGATQAQGDMATAAAEKASQLRDMAAGMGEAAPAQVSVKATLENGDEIAFDAQVTSRGSAPGEIAAQLAAQVQLHQEAEKQEEVEGAAAQDDEPESVA